ncbi:MAG: phosphoribosylamine--glycine ligase [Deltaproteobacteria bacterium]|nr:phosphoribosylamine--glycine ligase [Deltaproteobacteria bacterium]
MRVLVIGSGGREHALVWKLSQSSGVDRLYCAPGNAGIGETAQTVDIPPDKVSHLLQFAKSEKVDLTVVGPELPLTLGIVDRFEKAGLKIFGVNSQAAQLEGSKAFAKRLMQESRIPTAPFVVFNDMKQALRYLDLKGAPCVIKADGLAAGKGVTVAQTREEAEKAIVEAMKEEIFGDAGKTIIIEECLQGEELSMMALVDGNTVFPLALCQDHKALQDGDRGPNTGGMGAYSPVTHFGGELESEIVDTVLRPVVRALRKRGIAYRGVLYAGLMVCGGRPTVLEFNVRFGDPEAQPLLARYTGDLLLTLEAVVDQRLACIESQWDSRAAVCVVLTASGYPGSVRSGDIIQGLDSLKAFKDVMVFHAGTERKGDQVVTKGGRVLGVTALGETFPKAVERAYEAVGKIRWEGMHYRKDIGHRAVRKAA